MFDKIGHLASKHRYPIIAFWLILLAVVTIWAPNLSDVAISDQSGYLPANEPSIVAAAMAAKYFPKQSSPSQAVLILAAKQGTMRDQAAQKYIAQITNWVQHDLDPKEIGDVLSPADPTLRDQLISADGKVAIIFVNLTGSPEDTAVVNIIKAMQKKMGQAPADYTAYVTGSTATVVDYKSKAMESANRTTWLTILLVVLVLLLIYRSPVSPLVPLVTIALSYGISRGLIAWMSTFGWTISSITDVFLVVLLFGAGTDYCLFLISRFREFMADDLPGQEAAQQTVSRVGGTITSSAGTVIVGMIGMFFAKMKLFSNTGPSLAIGIVVVLLAGLTFTPALLSVLKEYAFWPLHPKHHSKDSRFWVWLADWVAHKPWIPLLFGILVLVPLALYGRGQKQGFDLLADLPNDTPSKAGYLLLADHFGAGEMQPLDIIVTGVDARSPAGLARADALTRKIRALPGIADVRSITSPAGKKDPTQGDALRVDKQLQLIVDEMTRSDLQKAGIKALTGKAYKTMLQQFAALNDYFTALSTAMPSIAQDASFQAATTALNRLETDLKEVHRQLLVSQQLNDAARKLGQSNTSSTAAGATDFVAMRDQFTALRAYLSGLTAAYPTIASLNGYGQVTAALDNINMTMDKIGKAMLVSTQLDQISASLATSAKQMQDPTQLSALLNPAGQQSGLGALGIYLRELATAYPTLARQPAFLSAATHLQNVQKATTALRQQLLLSRQLADMAQQVDASAKALATNPAALTPQPGQPTLPQQMAVMDDYLASLANAFPDLAATASYQTAKDITGQMRNASVPADPTEAAAFLPQAQKALNSLAGALTDLATTVQKQLPQATFMPPNAAANQANLAPQMQSLAQELAGASANIASLAEIVRKEMPEATFQPQTPLPGAENAPNLQQAMGKGVQQLAAALAQLSRSVATSLPEATYVAEGGASAPAATAMQEKLQKDNTALHDALQQLATTFANHRENDFFVPTALAGSESGLTRLLDTYTSTSGEATRIQVILADEPYSPAALKTVALLRDTMAHEKEKSYISGGEAILLDLENVMAKDTGRVMWLVLGGIAIVLILLLNSLVAPIYLLATILLSYGATLGLTRLLFGAIMHKDLTWWVPFFMFVLLIALGMDYNIFLMGRVKEETARLGTRDGTQRALQRTGGIITSAGIIMAGTFAAMMSSTLLGLVQLAFAITVGILLDTFIVRTTIVPAIVVLLGRWNWWPAKPPGQNTHG